MATRHKWHPVWIFAILAAGIGCRLPLSDSDPAVSAGILVVSVQDGPSRTSAPDVDIQTTYYTITGVGPGTAGFSVVTSSQTTKVKNLDFGGWTVTAEAWNATDQLLARGTAPAVVCPVFGGSVTVTVEPLAGFGTLELSASWPSGTVQSPSVLGRLIPPAGAAVGLVFASTGTESAVSVSSSVAAGYYTVVLSLLDSATVVADSVQVVRVADDGTTHATLQFSAATRGGPVQFDVTPQVDDPITVGLSGQLASLSVGSQMTVTASIPADAGEVVTTWYLNGEPIANGATSMIGSGLAAGAYRLDVIAVTVSGQQAGSMTHPFTVLESPTTSVSLLWDPNQDSRTVGYRLRYGQASGSYSTSADVGNRTAYTLQGLTAGLTYYIVVTAYDAQGSESGYSNQVVFNAPPRPPSTLTEGSSRAP